MAKNENTTGTTKKPWHPRVWHGMTVSAWFQLLLRNRFAVSPSCWSTAATISGASVLNSAFAAVQSIIFGRRIKRTQLRDDPIFILGHWRSGTTLLHELLALDDRHAYPTTYACLAPSHFLVSQHLMCWWLKFLIPECRPQDNVRVGLDRPQEDEWALCTMGLPSPYLAIAFPNRLRHFLEWVRFDGLSPQQLNRWIRSWRRFLQAVTLDAQKRLIIKSPLHTARIDIVLELFPNARFVHIVRDPDSVYPSTLRLWRRLSEDEGLQVPKCEQLEEFVLENFKRVYEAFEDNRRKIDPGRFCEIRYEDLIADPLRQLRRIYQQLNLGGYERVGPRLKSYLAEVAEFRTNQYSLSPQQRHQVAMEWEPIMKRLGYGAPRAA